MGMGKGNRRRLPPTVMVLYGATGDLSRRLVLPAWYRLAAEGLLPERWRLIGAARGDLPDEAFQALVKGALEGFGGGLDPALWRQFRPKLSFAGGGFSASDGGELPSRVAAAADDLGGDALVVHYLAVPPRAFEPITLAIGPHGLNRGSRVVYEKPFGTNLDQFRRLDAAARSVFDESQIYRIDHFLGKEAAQNIHVVRFANGLFSSGWDAEHIAAVQIDVPETLDVADRGGFYDATGAFLDMVVTHLFQLDAEVAMEPPSSLDAESVAAAREAAVSCFRTLDPGEAVFGQYDGYRLHKDVGSDSNTETFAAVRMWIDNDRWRGVPFLLRTGKCMARSYQRVNVIFKPPRRCPPGLPVDANVLTFELSGSGSISLSLIAKPPGVSGGLAAAKTTVDLAREFHREGLPAYSHLLHDVLVGDRTAFTRPDGLAQTWRAAAEPAQAQAGGPVIPSRQLGSRHLPAHRFPPLVLHPD